MQEQINFRGLEDHVQALVRAQGSESRVSCIPINSGNTLGASINHVTKDIDFEIGTDWDLMQYERIKRFVRKLRLRNPKKKVCEDVGFHEVGHNKLRNDNDGLGCPEDLKGKEICVDAVSEVMLAANKFSQQGALYLENGISDIINNLNCSNYSHLNGLSIFLAQQGELNSGKFSPFYEAFVKLNMQLWGRKKQKRLLSAYYTNDDAVDTAVARCIQDLGLNNNKSHNLDLLFNKDQWPETFSIFAKHLVGLMDQDVPEFLPGCGSGGKGYKVPINFEGEAGFDPEQVDDPGIKRVLDSDNMKKLMLRRNTGDEDLPSFVENWKALDYFYQALASELYIKAESPRKGQSMPIAPIQARPIDAESDSIESILFGRILLDEEGKPCLAVPRNYVEQQQDYKKSVKSYPELNIALLDTSISMKEAANAHGVGRTNIVPWGDNSKFHYANLTYSGVEKALHKMGVAVKTKYQLITFSSSTEATGEKSYDNRAEIKKRRYNPVFGGNTKIDVDVLARNARQPGSILMSISDGEIWNWDNWHEEPKLDDQGKVVKEGVKVKDRFRQIITDKFYVHFQIGEDTEATQDIESWGGTVVRISDASQMPRKAIDITQRFYSSYATGEIK